MNQDQFLIVDPLFPSIATTTTTPTTATTTTATTTTTTTDDQQEARLFAILDGHGERGLEVAVWVKEQLPRWLQAHQKEFYRDPLDTLKVAFLEVDRQLQDNEQIDTYISGTTVTLMILWNGQMYIANVGDSRIIMAKSPNQQQQQLPEGGQVVPLEVIQLTTYVTISARAISLSHTHTPHPHIDAHSSTP